VNGDPARRVPDFISRLSKADQEVFNFLLSQQTTDHIDRAFQTLTLYGVQRERAKTVPNGIDVLMTRMKKEVECLNQEITELRSRLGLGQIET